MLKFEPIGFQQACALNVAIKTAISDFVIFEIGKNNQILLYTKTSKDGLGLSSNRNICERTIVDGYEYKIFSQYVEKQLSFTVLNALKGHFCVIYKILAFFHFQILSHLGPSKKCSSVIFCVLDENLT